MAGMLQGHPKASQTLELIKDVDGGPRSGRARAGRGGVAEVPL